MKQLKSEQNLGQGRSIVVVGAGGHAKVVVECLRLAGWNVVGCTDSDPSPRFCAGVPVIGNDDKLSKLFAEGVKHALCAIGDNHIREKMGDELLALGFEVPAVCGPGAIISPSVRIGSGAMILPAAVVNAETALGDFAIVNTNSSIDHDCTVGRAAHIGPGSVLAGSVHVENRAFIATGCVVIPGRKVGPDTVVGAGSVVVDDLGGGVIAYGSPARVRRFV